MQRFCIAANVASETIDGESIVIDLKSGAYFSFQGWSAWAWEALIAGETVGAITAAFGGIDGVDGFVASLTSAGLISDRASDVAPSATPAQPTDSVTAPIAERFDDLADMILLDPVHEVDRNAGWPRPDQSV